MPYNTTAIPPRKEVTGQTQLPLTRVKKIIAQDQDIGICSNNAAFVITLATEMFIQYIATEGLNSAKLDRKPRKNIQYKDMANAISHKDNLEFLADLVPKTVPYKEIKAKAAATRAQLDGSAAAAAAAAAARDTGAAGEDGTTPATDEPQQKHPEEDSRGPLPNGKKPKKSSSAKRASSSTGPGAGQATLVELLAKGKSGNNASTGGKKEQSKEDKKDKKSRPSNASQAPARGEEDEEHEENPNDQLELEASQARGHDDDVEMAD